MPTLGVCLGHQGIIHAYGGKITHAKKLMHGKTCIIKHDQKGNLYMACATLSTRQGIIHLLENEALFQTALQITAEAVDDGEIMGIRHVNYPIYGVQFHPESILCEDGKLIIKNFLGGQNS